MTWDVALNQITFPAQTLLRLLCWFASDPIPKAVPLTPQARLIFYALSKQLAFPGTGAASDRAAGEVEDALQSLAVAGVVERDDASETFRLDRRVQQGIRTLIEPDQKKIWLRCSMSIIKASLPRDPPPYDVRSWPRWEPLRPHVEAAIRNPSRDSGTPWSTSSGTPASPNCISALVLTVLRDYMRKCSSTIWRNRCSGEVWRSF